jgi:hypothetical protein
MAELNDLLQLDVDAVAAYTLAIAALRRDTFRETLLRFRGDHQRHVEDLSALIRDHGGTPIKLPHIPTGVFKLAVQAVGVPAGDWAVLLAFKTNEAQVRDKYARHAAAVHAPDIAALLRRNAEDEERHYAWVMESLERLGVGYGTIVGTAADAFAAVHGTTADVIEGGGRLALEMAGRVRPILWGLNRP